MDYGLFFTYLAACGAAAATGALFSPGDWYKAIRKPSWTPPDWLFPVAWTTLYLCMSLAAERVARQAGQDPVVGMALAFYALQIGLNTLEQFEDSPDYDPKVVLTADTMVEV